MPLQVKERYKALPMLKREHVIKIENTEFRTIRKTKLWGGHTAGGQTSISFHVFSLEQSQLLSGMYGDSSINPSCLRTVSHLFSKCGSGYPGYCLSMVLSNRNSPLARKRVVLFLFVFFYFHTSGLQLAVSRFHCSNGNTQKRVGTQKLPKICAIVRHKAWWLLCTKLNLIPLIMNKNINKAKI